MGRVSLAVTEHDDTTVRQLIDTIKVMGEGNLLIIFKGGFEVEQMMYIYYNPPIDFSNNLYYNITIVKNERMVFLLNVSVTVIFN